MGVGVGEGWGVRGREVERQAGRQAETEQDQPKAQPAKARPCKDWWTVLRSYSDYMRL